MMPVIAIAIIATPRGSLFSRSPTVGGCVRGAACALASSSHVSPRLDTPSGMYWECLLVSLVDAVTCGAVATVATDAPDTDRPDTDCPETDRPETDRPDTDPPDTDPPDTDPPESDPPDSVPPDKVPLDKVPLDEIPPDNDPSDSDPPDNGPPDNDPPAAAVGIVISPASTFSPIINGIWLSALPPWASESSKKIIVI